MEYALFILYVADQQVSRNFYRQLLGQEPSLDVPGMTEFRLNDGALLGLMPEDGIARILGDGVPHPREGTGIPRAELYIPVADVATAYATLQAAGGTPVSEPAKRNWGDTVAYGLDLDGHVIALASRNAPKPGA